MSASNDPYEIYSQAGGFWLSFVRDGIFAGALLANGQSFDAALNWSWRTRLNPGGEVQGLPIEQETWDRIPAHFHHKLLTRAECEQFDREMGGDDQVDNT
jgi:hypothetical protein